MVHLNEQLLEQFLLDPPRSATERESIEDHLERCEGCAALYTAIRTYYQEVEQLREAHERALMIGSRIARRGDASVHRSWISRNIAVARRFVSAHRAGSSMAAAMVLGLVFTVFLTSEKPSPAFARAKEEFLIAYGAGGEELWRRHIGPGYDAERISSVNYYYGLGTSIVVTIDVDGDHVREVIAAFGVTTGDLGNTIICFEHDGSERWRYVFRREMTFGETEFADDFSVDYITAGDFDGDGGREIIAYARNIPYYPSAIFKLNAADGSFVSEYWHAGWLSAAFQTDLNGDGIKEFVFGGQNNSFDQSILAVFDPRWISGSGPTGDHLVPKGRQTGSQIAYILLPRSGLSHLADKPRGAVSMVRTSGGFLEALVTEHIGGRVENIAVLYFDNTLTCVRVGEHDDLAATYERFRAKGTSIKPLKELREDFKRGIRYWNGHEFTPVPVLLQPGAPVRQEP